MKNLAIRAITGLVLVWAIIEATASENMWYYILWGVICIGSVVELYGLLLRQSPARSWLWALGGLLYIGLSGWVLWQMADHWRYIIVMLTMVWSNDVGAYLTGMTMGKHKMMPRISPKKTWEGFFGGLVFAAAVALLWLHINPLRGPISPMFLDVVAWQWALVGVVVGIAAVLGDMLESVMKRTMGVKDSGNILPGHGGLLDRFDATFMALPVFYVLLLILGII